MAGGFQKDISQADRVEILNTQISELEKRKNNLQSEVETYYRNYKSNLDLEAHKAIKKIESDYSDKIASLDKREDAIKKKESFLVSREESLKAETAAILKSAKAKEELAGEVIDRYKDLSFNLETEYKKKAQDLANKASALSEDRERLNKEKESLRIIQDAVREMEKQNTNLRNQISVELENIEARKNYLDYTTKDLASKDNQLSQREKEIQAKDLELNNRSQAVIKQEAKILESSAMVNQLLDEAKSKIAATEAKDKKIKEDSVKLSDWRDVLNEQQLTSNEKERSLILKERLIDSKIRVLQELRAADSKPK